MGKLLDRFSFFRGRLAMEQFDELIAHLPDKHRSALRWFAERAGTEQPWPGTLYLANRRDRMRNLTIIRPRFNIT